MGLRGMILCRIEVAQSWGAGFRIGQSSACHGKLLSVVWSLRHILDLFTPIYLALVRVIWYSIKIEITKGGLGFWPGRPWLIEKLKMQNSNSLLCDPAFHGSNIPQTTSWTWNGSLISAIHRSRCYTLIKLLSTLPCSQIHRRISDPHSPINFDELQDVHRRRTKKSNIENVPSIHATASRYPSVTQWNPEEINSTSKWFYRQVYSSFPGQRYATKSLRLTPGISSKAYMANQSFPLLSKRVRNMLALSKSTTISTWVPSEV